MPVPRSEGHGESFGGSSAQPHRGRICTGRVAASSRQRARAHGLAVLSLPRRTNLSRILLSQSGSTSPKRIAQNRRILPNVKNDTRLTNRNFSSHQSWKRAPERAAPYADALPDLAGPGRRALPLASAVSKNDHSRVPCALILKQIGDRKRYLEPKMTIHESMCPDFGTNS